MIDCATCNEFLIDYLEGTLPPEQHAEFARHMQKCTHCREYLRQYEATVRAEKAAWPTSPDEMLEDVPEEIIHAILAARQKGDDAAQE